MTVERQREIVALRNDARVYEDMAETYHDTAIAEMLRQQVKHFRKLADDLERERE